MRTEQAKMISQTTMEAIRRLDGARSRQEVVSIHADWCEWADRNGVCRQIREHMNEKAAGLRAQFAEPRPRDHKLEAAADR